MNILTISSFGMYADYTLSFIHNQNKAFVRQGHRVRALILIAAGKASYDGRRFGSAVEFRKQDGVELCYVRYFSMSSYGPQFFNQRSAAFFSRLHAAKIMRDFSPDVIHASAVDLGGPVGVYLKKQCGAPLVLTTLGSDTTVTIQRGGSEWLRKYCDQADYLTANSYSLLENYERIHTKTPRTCIISGFEIENLCECSKIRHHVVQVGFLVPSKHNDYTLRAVAALRKQYPDITLTIVGSGSEEANLRELCNTLDISECVHFTGRLSNKDTLAEMAAAEIFIMPSYPEGLGIVYLEAMASGCVVIGTQGEGISGVVSHGESGFLVPRDDIDTIVQWVDRCFRDPPLMQRVACAGKSIARSLTWDHNAEQYVKLFKELCS